MRAALKAVTTTKDMPMSDRKPTELDELKLDALETVTGGTNIRGTYCGGGSNNVLSQLSALADSVKDITNKTSGFSGSQFLLLALAFAAQRNSWGGGGGVVYYAGPPRFW
jgi:hypothetical protein